MQGKLQSQRGASITFALLLFLVCAVISSAVIVAGTTAAGRMSQMAEMDQRYYAVTSAAELMKDSIDGRTVKVKYTKSSMNAEAVSVTNEKNHSLEWEGVDPDSVVSDKPPYFITEASLNLVKSLKAPTSTTTPAPSATPGPFSLKPSSSPPTDTKLDCDIIFSLTNRLLVFKISSASIDDSEKYTLDLTFSSNVREYAADASSDIVYTDVTWNFLSLHKVR